VRLTDKAVKAAVPRKKPFRLFDGEGLYLDVRPNGSKYWRMKCRFNAKEVRLAFGVYPKVSLAEARQQRRKAQDALNAGKDPRQLAIPPAETTFRAVAKAWFEARKGGWDARYAATVLHRLESDVFRRLGDTEITRIDAQEVLSVIRPIDQRGAPEKAKRVLRYINGIFAYAIITLGDMRYNPALGLHVAIRTRPVKHNPFLTERELPEFLKRLDEYQGDRITVLAAKFLLLTMTRTSETRFARPEEIDWKEQVWKIPAERMKMGRPHWVPLSRQAIIILKEAVEGGGEYIFSSPVRRSRPISENTILYALYDLGYRGKLTGHGFRATASTILNERGYNSLAIERQLAHVDRNTVRAAYNHAEFLNERREILQVWADLLDDLRSCR
jgi:integrase